LMVGWRMRWMWTERVRALRIAARTGVVEFSKGVDRIACTYRLDDFHTHCLGDLIRLRW